MGEQLPLLIAAVAAVAVVLLLAASALVRRARRETPSPVAAAPAQAVSASPAPADALATQADALEDRADRLAVPAGTVAAPADALPAPADALPALAAHPSENGEGGPTSFPAVVLGSAVVADSSVDRPTLSIEVPAAIVTTARDQASTGLPTGVGPACRAVDGFESAGLLARDAWARAYALEERRHARYGRPCAVVAVSLDGLEALSLRIGSEAAERLVRPLVETLAGRGRGADLVCRVDRTRIVALLPETDEDGASAYVARIRETCDPWLAAAPVPVRLSLGWASPAPGATLASALVAAEQRMAADRGRPIGAPTAATSESRSARRGRFAALARSGVATPR